jgi:dTMP kinase
MQKGLFIVFEGGEGSGKTTQSKLLKDYLEKKGFKVIVTREPGGTPTGEKIRDILKDPILEKTPLSELLLFNASRSCHIWQKILPETSKGTMVISDRFSDSSIAYQCGGRKLPHQLVKKINDLAVGKHYPDMVFIITGDVEKALNAAKKVSAKDDHFEKEKLEFHNRVKNAYLKIAKEKPKNHKIINGDQEIEKVHQDIVKEINKLLKNK